jgi:GH24 family phage-related lysozyme (muramidase)
MAKYKNIVGTPFPDYVQTQINKRQELVNSTKRDSSTIQWLTNRNSFVRLSSGANVYTGTVGHTPDLAKANVLQGGTVAVNNETDSTTIKKGFKETYKQGTDDQLGLRPMPGIVGLSVDTGGKWQTTLEATVEIICYDLDQLDTIQKLYMSLGVTVFLEWGHNPYIDNNGSLQKNIRPINFFNFTKKRDLLKAVTTKRKETNGNYDALVGTVFNFDWSANTDGSYNCSISILGPGGMVESLRINNPVKVDYDQSTSDEVEKYTSKIENALIAIKKFLERSDLARRVTKFYGPDTTVTNLLGVIDNSNFSSLFVEVQDPNSGEGIKLSYRQLLNLIYKDAAYRGPAFFDNNDIVGSDSVRYGNAWQREAGLDDPNLKELDISSYYGYTAVQGTTKVSYITLTHLLTIVQHLGVFAERPLNAKGDSEAPVLIDYNPGNTIGKTGVIQASIDPKVCLVPFKVKDETTYARFFYPLNIRANSKQAWQQEGDITVPAKYNLALAYERSPIGETFAKLGQNINTSNESGIGYDGKLCNVLVNIDFALNEFKRLSNNNKQEVSLIAYINAILDGINLSLGSINNFRAFHDDTSHCVRIVDHHYNEKLTEETTLEIPIYGTKSTVYNYGFKSSITPNLASQIVISTQALNGGGIKQLPSDVLSYQKLNWDVLDRFSEIKYVDQLTTDNNPSTLADTRKPLYKLYKHLYGIYFLKTNLKESEYPSFTKIYSDVQNLIIKVIDGKSGTLLIPLEYDITMDGISGILPYNAFKVPDNRLPAKYKGRVAFAVFSINHSFDNNKWQTTLRGLTILLDTSPLDDNVDIPAANPSELRTSLFQNVQLGGPSTTPEGAIIFAGSPLSTTDIIAAREFIKIEEGFRERAYWDVNAWRIGYGSDTITKLTGDVKTVIETTVTTREEAQNDLDRRLLNEFKPEAVRKLQSQGINYDTMSTATKVVFIDLAYNYGTVYDDLSGAYARGFREGGIDAGKRELIFALTARAARGENQTPSRRFKEIDYLKRFN